MCGICGIIGTRQPGRNQAALGRMMAALRHRGPDGEGSFTSAGIAVGMRRLSIIDLPGGAQPIWNEARTLAVVFNGEIYNFRELRRELESLGHTFRTNSDTEVIVHAYEAWGDDFLGHLRGMFAFALMEMPGGPNGPVERLLIARDRLGIKPLYCGYADGSIIFASEMRALLASGLIAPEVSTEALSSFLLFGSVCEPSTIVEGVFSLPPGRFLEIFPDRVSAALQPKLYWSPQLAIAGRQPCSPPEHDASAHLRSLLESSVREHLAADVPVGVFLSGGIDSTAIAALASRERSGIRSFTVAFEEQEFSEAAVARRTAQQLGIEHQEYVLSGDEMLDRMDEALAAFDQPSMDGINTYFVSWAARQAGLKVALSGLGSDELFGGYPTFQATPRIERLSKFANSLPRPVRAALKSGAERFGTVLLSADGAKKLACAFDDPSTLPHPYFFTRSLFPPRMVSDLLPERADRWSGFSWWQWLASLARETQSSDAFASVSWLELRSYMLHTLLRDTDVMSMSHSLEVRVPFLDHRVVEFVLSLPQSAKQKGGIAKSLLIEALSGLLPREVIERKKRTFTLPWEKWLRGPLRARVEEGFRAWSSPLESAIRQESARGVWNDFLAGKTTWSRPWSLYALNEWTKRNLTTNQNEVTDAELSAATVA